MASSKQGPISYLHHQLSHPHNLVTFQKLHLCVHEALREHLDLYYNSWRRSRYSLRKGEVKCFVCFCFVWDVWKEGDLRQRRQKDHRLLATADPLLYCFPVRGSRHRVTSKDGYRSRTRPWMDVLGVITRQLRSSVMLNSYLEKSL